VLLLLIATLATVFYYQTAKNRAIQHLKVADVNSICRTDTMLTYVTFQGIVNKKEPRIYFTYDWENGWTDRQWLIDTIVPAGYTYENVSDPTELIDAYKEEINGITITDPNIEATKNIATMISGLTGNVAATPEIAALLQKKGLQVKEDLRGKWQNNIEATAWAYENLYASCSDRYLASLDPSAMHLRDFLVENRIFTFWLDTKENATAEEKTLLNQILTNKPNNIPVLGWWNDEDTGVRTAAQHGKYVLATDWATNLSVHSKIKTTLPLKQKAENTHAPLNTSRIYISFTISDGDNIQYCMNQMRKPLWQDPAHGTIPLGWTISPSLLDLAPSIIKWYYQNASLNDTFICGPSGAGYTYPDAQTDLAEFMNRTDTYCNLTALKTIWTLGARSPQIIESMTKSIASVTSIAMDYSTPTYQEPYLMNDKPIVPCGVWADDIQRTVNRILTIANTTSTRPLLIFAGATCWKMNATAIRMIMDTLKMNSEFDFEFVKPDQLMALIQENLEQ